MESWVNFSGKESHTEFNPRRGWGFNLGPSGWEAEILPLRQPLRFLQQQQQPPSALLSLLQPGASQTPPVPANSSTFQQFAAQPLQLLHQLPVPATTSTTSAASSSQLAKQIAPNILPAVFPSTQALPVQAPFPDLQPFVVVQGGAGASAVAGAGGQQLRSLSSAAVGPPTVRYRYHEPYEMVGYLHTESYSGKSHIVKFLANERPRTTLIIREKNSSSNRGCELGFLPISYRKWDRMQAKWCRVSIIPPCWLYNQPCIKGSSLRCLNSAATVGALAKLSVPFSCIHSGFSYLPLVSRPHSWAPCCWRRRNRSAKNITVIFFSLFPILRAVVYLAHSSFARRGHASRSLQTVNY